MLVLSGKASFWSLPSSVPWDIKTYPFCAAFKEYGGLGVQFQELYLGLQKRMPSEQQGLRKISCLKKKKLIYNLRVMLFLFPALVLSSSNSLVLILSFQFSLAFLLTCLICTHSTTNFFSIKNVIKTTLKLVSNHNNSGFKVPGVQAVT